MQPLPVFSARVDALNIHVFRNRDELGNVAAIAAAEIITAAILMRGYANIILATGNSQLTFLQALRQQNLDWSRVNIFHMDEYVALPADHPASFKNFLTSHFINHISPHRFYQIDTAYEDIQSACDDYAQLIKQFPAHLCALGIGENGHIAFNDPPFADFDDPLLVKQVALDMRSRQQQVNEGHFPSLEAVPTHAVTLTIPALLAARQMLCIVPEARKAQAVRAALLGDIDPQCPASILRHAAHCTLYLDLESASEVTSVIKPGT